MALQTLALVDQNGLLAELIDVHEWAEPYRDMPLAGAHFHAVSGSLPRHPVWRACLPHPLAQRRDQGVRRWRAGVPLPRRPLAAGGRALSLRDVEGRHRQRRIGGTPVFRRPEPYREPPRRAVRRAGRIRESVRELVSQADMLDHINRDDLRGRRHQQRPTALPAARQERARCSVHRAGEHRPH